MAKLADIPDSQRAMCDGQTVDEAPAADRRKNERQIATFRTCCIVINGEAHPAILRNMSDGGAMFEALVTVQPDMWLTYWWDGIEPVEARVAWVEGNRIGVANLSGPAAPIPVPRPRATRVPARLPVRLWCCSAPRWSELVDISMSGIAVRPLDGVEPGSLCTIEVAGQTLPNATIVRSDDRVTGIKFERPLPPAKLIQLLEDGLAAQHNGTKPVLRRPQATAASVSPGTTAESARSVESGEETAAPCEAGDQRTLVRRLV